MHKLTKLLPLAVIAAGLAMAPTLPASADTVSVSDGLARVSSACGMSRGEIAKTLFSRGGDKIECLEADGRTTLVATNGEGGTIEITETTKPEASCADPTFTLMSIADARLIYVPTNRLDRVDMADSFGNQNGLVCIGQPVPPSPNTPLVDDVVS